MLKEALEYSNKYPGRLVTFFVLALSAFYFLLLSSNHVTLVTVYSNDLFFILDGGHRVFNGQIPSVDFPSSIGALTYVLPALARSISGSYESVYATINGFSVLLFVPSILFIMHRRFSPAVTLITATYLLAVLAVPMTLDVSTKQLTLAMYYNRLCWVAITIVFMYAAPLAKDKVPAPVLEGGIMALLLLFMFYIKITYAVIGFAFAGYIYVFYPEHRRSIALSFVFTFGAMLLVETLWHLHLPYFHDIWQTLMIRSAVRGGLSSIIYSIVHNSLDIFSLAFVTLLIHYLFNPDRKTYIFFALTLLLSLLIINQNAHRQGLVALIGTLAVAVEYALQRAGSLRSTERSILKLSLFAALLFFTLHPTLSRTMNLMYYFQQTRGLNTIEMSKNLKGLYFRQTDSGLSLQSALFFERSLDGSRWLDINGAKNCKVSALNFSNPFSVLNDLPPPKGDYVGYHIGRNISDTAAIDFDRVYGDVDIVMVSRYENLKQDQMWELFGEYIISNFSKYDETRFWSVYTRSDPVFRSSRDCGIW